MNKNICSRLKNGYEYCHNVHNFSFMNFSTFAKINNETFFYKVLGLVVFSLLTIFEERKKALQQSNWIGTVLY